MHVLASALRPFRSRPGFSLLIVLLLALGIGANTAMFSVVHAVLLRPLPYPQPGDLVQVRKEAGSAESPLPGRGEFVTDRELLAWREAGLPAVQAFAAYGASPVTWLRGEGAERVLGGQATPEFFPLLGVAAWRGRLPGPDDARPGAAPVAVIAHELWQNRFGGRDDALGEPIVLDGTAHTLVGVLPPSFLFNEPVQVWRPLILHEATAPGEVRIALVRVLARLAPGADRAAATAQLAQASDRFWTSLAATAPLASGAAPQGAGGPGGLSRVTATAGNGGPPAPGAPAGAARPPEGGGNPGARMLLGFAGGAVQLVPLQEYLAGQLRPALWLLLGAVTLVLLIACVNVAHLQLARATVRRREFAVRAALGASRGQLAAGLLAENLLLALFGGALGAAGAFFGVKLLHVALAGRLPRVAPLAVDGPVLAFGVAAAILAGVGFGFAPAWSVRGLGVAEALHTGGRTGTGGAGRSRWRQACVALEIAVALALVADAGLLLRSFAQLRGTDVGYRTADVLAVTVPLDRRYAEAARQREFAARLGETAAALPGVAGFAHSDHAPLSEYNVMILTRIEGRPPPDASREPPLSGSSVSPGYFDTLGIALRAGRVFTEADGDGAPLVAAVNEAFVRSYFPDGESPLGHRIASPAAHGQWATIVGVVADTRPRGVEREAQPELYFPYAQWPQPRLAAFVRVADGADAGEVGRALGAALRRLDPTLPFDPPQTLEARLDRLLAPRKLVLNLLGAFAGAAVLLAAVGIFGVMAYAVAQRTHEFGVRMALGADDARILRHVLAGAGAAVGAGLLGGLALTFATSRLIKASLVAVSEVDPLVLTAAALLLAAVGFAAALVPALRASRVNPVVALRAD